jgi:DNA invertase Pin-like site-specific DNA recombinase
MIYGYARVSTTEQETTLQLDALQRVGVDEIVQEKCGGVSDRPKLKALLRKLKKGDKVYVWKIDRFARSFVHLSDVMRRIDAAGATFHSITQPIDTSNALGMMMLQLLGIFAEFERSMIRERSMAGQKIARENGIHCGRPRALSKEQEAELVRLYQTGLYTMQTLATRYDIHLSAVKRAIYRVTKPNSTSLR